jgi:hypothetical protein
MRALVKVSLLVLILFLPFMTGCDKESDPEIDKVCYQQLDAMNRGDIPAYMETMDESSPVYQPTKEALEQIVPVYKLKAEMEGLEVISIQDDRATIKVTQTTRKISGPEFIDNRSVFEHKLRKVNGKWKFVESKMLKSEKI